MGVFKRKKNFGRHVILIAKIYKNCHAIDRSGGELVQVEGLKGEVSGSNRKGRE